MHDWVCEGQKAIQNGIYAGNKATCETEKAGQNALYQSQKAVCETSKAAQNAIFSANKLRCESEKAGQNTIYSTKKLLCETAKTSGKLACEAKKAIETAICLASNRHTGDLISPATINLFRRAMNMDPALSPDFVYILFPLIVLPNSLVGDAELIANQSLLGKTTKGSFPNIQVFDDPDNVGDDLNNVIHLVMSRHRFSSAGTNQAIASYIANRKHSYGSYLGTYYRLFGDKTENMTALIAQGISNGWKPDVSSSYGAFRWYYRPSSGGNPRLGTIYAPIIERFVK